MKKKLLKLTIILLTITSIVFVIGTIVWAYTTPLSQTSLKTQATFEKEFVEMIKESDLGIERPRDFSRRVMNELTVWEMLRVSLEIPSIKTQTKLKDIFTSYYIEGIISELNEKY